MAGLLWEIHAYGMGKSAIVPIPALKSKMTFLELLTWTRGWSPPLPR